MPATKGVSVLIKGVNRDNMIAIAPCLLKKNCAFSNFFSVTKRDPSLLRAIMVPKCSPISKFTKSPNTAEIDNTMIIVSKFNPCKEKVEIDPTKNKIESPGKNGKMTSPVSIKIRPNNNPYTSKGFSCVNCGMYVLKLSKPAISIVIMFLVPNFLYYPFKLCSTSSIFQIYKCFPS